MRDFRYRYLDWTQPAGKTIAIHRAVADGGRADFNNQMFGARSRRAIGVSFLLAAVVAAGAEAAPPADPWAGRTVVEALGALNEPGLEFIYSSELVPDDLRVLEEPRTGSRLLTARDILAQHGLALQLVRTGIYAVVRDDRAAAGDMPAREMSRSTTQLTPLAEVVVSTSRYALEGAAPIGAVQVSGSELAAQPVLGEDAIRALGRLPGMAQNGFSAQSNVRGGEAGETLTLVDGFDRGVAYRARGLCLAYPESCRGSVVRRMSNHSNCVPSCPTYP